MKKKRIITVIAIAAAAAVVLIILAVQGGLLAPTAKSLAGRAARALAKTQSVTVSQDVEFSGDVQTQGMTAKIDLTATAKMNVHYDPFALYSEQEQKVNIATAGSVTDTYTYVLGDGDDIQLYYSVDGTNWYKETMAAEDYKGSTASDTALYQAIADGKADASLKDGTTSVDGKEAYQLDLTLTGNVLKQVVMGTMSSTEGTASNSYGDVDWDSTSAKATILLYKDSALPAKLTLDCRDFGQAMIKSYLGNLDASLSIDTFTIEMDMTGYDSAEEVTVPDYVSKNAVALTTQEEEGTTQAASTEAAAATEPGDTAAETAKEQTTETAASDKAGTGSTAAGAASGETSGSKEKAGEN